MKTSIADKIRICTEYFNHTHIWTIVLDNHKLYRVCKMCDCVESISLDMIEWSVEKHPKFESYKNYKETAPVTVNYNDTVVTISEDIDEN